MSIKMIIYIGIGNTLFRTRTFMDLKTLKYQKNGKIGASVKSFSHIFKQLEKIKCFLIIVLVGLLHIYLNELFYIF